MKAGLNLNAAGRLPVEEEPEPAPQPEFVPVEQWDLYARKWIVRMVRNPEWRKP